MTGRTPYDGFRAVDPGGPKTARHAQPRQTLPHAVPVTPCSPPSGGRARRAARAGAFLSPSSHAPTDGPPRTPGCIPPRHMP